MKTILSTLTLLVPLCLLIGCLQSVPITPGSTNTVSQVNTQLIDQVRDTVIGVNAASAPVNPYAPIIQPVVYGLAGIITAASTIVAMIKNKQKNQHQDAAAALASTLVKAGPVPTSVLQTIQDPTAISHIIDAMPK